MEISPWITFFGTGSLDFMILLGSKVCSREDCGLLFYLTHAHFHHISPFLHTQKVIEQKEIDMSDIERKAAVTFKGNPLTL